MAEWLGSLLDSLGISVGAYTLTIWILEIVVCGVVGWRIGMSEKRKKELEASYKNRKKK